MVLRTVRWVRQLLRRETFGTAVASAGPVSVHDPNILIKLNKISVRLRKQEGNIRRFLPHQIFFAGVGRHGLNRFQLARDLRL